MQCEQLGGDIACISGWPPFQPKKIPVSLNLPVVCRRLVELFCRLDQITDLLGHEGNSELQEMAQYRYTFYWLPLAAEYKLTSGAPLDVYWVWIAHMLDPVVYRQDCQRMFGNLVEHRLSSSKKEKQITDKARAMWQSHHPKEPFDFDPKRTGYVKILDKTQCNGRPVQYGTKISDGVASVMKCHPHFFYQVSLPHYQEVDFLERAERRYKMFLHLKKVQHHIHQGFTSVPNEKNTNFQSNSLHCTSSNFHERCTNLHYLPFDIELCWRAHILHPRIYARNTSCLIGQLLPHTCSVYQNCMLTYLVENKHTFRSNSTENSDKRMVPGLDELWSACFPEEPLARPGSTDRGMGSRNQLTCLTTSDVYKMATKAAQVTINQVTAQLNPGLEKFSIRIQHSGQRFGEPDTSSSGMFGAEHCVARLNSPGRVWSATGPRKPIARLSMTSGVHDELIIELIDKRGWLCPSNSLLSRVQLSFTTLLERFPGTEPLDIEFGEELNLETSLTDFSRIAHKSPRSIHRSSTIHSNSGNTTLTAVKKSVNNAATKSFVRLLVNVTPPTRHAVRLKVQLGPVMIVRVPRLRSQPGDGGIAVWGFTYSSPSLEPCCVNQEPDNLTSNCNMLKAPQEDLNFVPDTPLLKDDRMDNLKSDDETRSLLLIHKVLNHIGDHVFTVRILHSVAHKLSTVHVLKDGCLLCVGHTLDHTELPTVSLQRKVGRKFQTVQHNDHMDPTWKKTLEMFAVPWDHFITRTLTNGTQQGDEFTNTVLSAVDGVPSTSSEGITSGWGFHPNRKEKAMIVKDSQGDWCMVIGHWDGFKRFPEPQVIPPMNDTSKTSQTQHNGSYSTRGNGGHLSLRMRYLRPLDVKTTFAQVPDTMNSLSVILQNAMVNLKTGEINISKDCEEIAQNVCLAFCCSILHVLCQPRILVQESVFDAAHIALDRSSFQPAISRPSESIMTNLSTAGDQDPVSLMTASTSFDSTSPVQHPSRVNTICEQYNDCRSSGSCSSTGHKIEWIMTSEPVIDCKAEGVQLAGLWNSVQTKTFEDPTSFCSESIEVLGVPQFILTPAGERRRTEFSIHPAHLRPLSIQECFDHIVACEQERKRRVCSAPYNEGYSCGRGLMASLSFVMCQASGILLDTLIPSIQHLRHLERSKQLSAVLQQNALESSSLGSHDNTPHESCEKNDSPQNHIKSNSATTITRKVFHKSNITHEDKDLISPLKSSNELQLNHISKLCVPSKMVHIPIHSAVNLSRQPFVGWRLSDFYDYFLLELPDICPGCLNGCQFCSGIGVL
ncbi:hypothetical protein CRM22_003830 [Opisthorchis felineus]|uniref:Uncharacterized protein n=1 Tax=Opisthorchis felineus TaxID=147828 RepID=A0A4V3SFQ0_OPIFE|nr:hypothetical protein CRM22_003830 [Opisthorchis felineus]